MKSGIHPKWNHQAVVTCGCGNTFMTGSTQDAITVDVCYSCHPFYTGKMKFLDTQGRVERFMNKRKAAQITIKAKKNAQTSKGPSLSLREMLEVEKKKLAASESAAAKSSKQN